MGTTRKINITELIALKANEDGKCRDSLYYKDIYRSKCDFNKIYDIFHLFKKIIYFNGLDIFTS